MFAKRFFISAVLVFFSTVGFAQSRAEIIQKANNAVVTIFSYDENGRQLGQGSGFIVQSNGIVVSNFHVIEEAQSLKIQNAGGQFFELKGVVDVDQTLDFVVLKIEKYGHSIIQVGRSSGLGIGEDVIAIGSPQGLKNSASTGIVSSFRTVRGVSLIQTTAPISPGSSGGPLLNARGEVVGIVTATRVDGQNLNFALPIDHLKGSIGADALVNFKLTDISERTEGSSPKGQNGTPNEAQSEPKKSREISQKEPELGDLIENYEDPSSRFSVVRPKYWTTQRKVETDKDGTRTISLMFAPSDAERKELDGYLSKGLRFNFSYPTKTKEWPNKITSEALGKEIEKDAIKSNEGFVVTKRSIETLGETGKKAYVFKCVVENYHISEPESATFVVAAAPHFLLIVELVCPASEAKVLQPFYEALMTSFTAPRF